MKLESEFYRLPLKFDIDRLVEEVATFSESDWMSHPMNYKGNSAIPLISVNGEFNDEFTGPMATTPALDRCPYIQQVLATFNCVFGRSRLMRLEGQCEVPPHSDITYHWYSRVRIHVPIITYPDVTFYCNQKKVHMAAGEAWIFDSWKTHRVVNPQHKPRIHLVADTAGSADFWQMIERSERPVEPASNASDETVLIPYQPDKKQTILTEKFNGHIVMSPGEVDALLVDLVDEVQADQQNLSDATDVFTRSINHFRWEWRKTWHLYGATSPGWPYYKSLIQQLHSAVTPLKDKLVLSSNQADAITTLESRVLAAAFHPELAATSKQPTPQQNPATPTSHRKIGRNEPCPCGSGRKYKQCHG